MSRIAFACLAMMIVTAAGCTAPAQTPDPTSTAAPPTQPPAAPTAMPLTFPTVPDDLYDRVSIDRLMATLEDLTAIQPYSGWRHSATDGEAQATDGAIPPAPSACKGGNPIH